MDSTQKALSSLTKIPLFKAVIEKLTTGQQLSNSEHEYILACAIVLLKEYEEDRRSKAFAEFSYYIILKYSLTTGDYMPLYDFTANFGYYPITRKLFSDGLIDGDSITDQLVEIQLENFQHETHVETLHQNLSRVQLLDYEGQHLLYVAPTSYGKSAVIVEYIRKVLATAKRIAVIVPTKSLLMQTFRLIRRANLGRRLIIHDEMYQQQSSFIAILTQERCLRLMSKHSVYFDLLFIDEAHNILRDDERNILLSRLILRNTERNPNQQVVYLSPLVDDAENIKVQMNQAIQSFKIPFNIKEPEIFEFKKDNFQYQYNRFVNNYYQRSSSTDIYSYIFKHSKLKNFLYCLRPVHIEKLAIELANRLPSIPLTVAMRKLIRTLKEEVHEQFYLVGQVEKGVIYLHGKLPDIIKEYLESKFAEIPEIKYIVANTVILEGVNLPIDNLYILNTTNLGAKELTNLIGRVDRLNTIFGPNSGPAALEKLLPPVHFVNNDEYNRSNGNMSAKIELLRSSIFKDKIKNCTLVNYNIDTLGLKGEQKEKRIKEDEKILADEAFLSKDPKSRIDKLKQYLLESGISFFYTDVDHILKDISNRINQFNGSTLWTTLSICEKIYQLFIRGMEGNITDREFVRLSHAATRSFYDSYMSFVQRRSLKHNIVYLFRHFKRLIADGNNLFYVGHSYGELPWPNTRNPTFNTHIDLSQKKDPELINLAIVKLKMEDEFVSFKLNKFIIMLNDYKLITTQEYNEHIFGTNDQRKIDLTKLGLTISLINRLEADGLLDLIQQDVNGNLIPTDEFNRKKSDMSDLYRFEVERFLS